MTGVVRAWPPPEPDGRNGPAAADPRLDDLEYAVVDCETTGGSPGRGHRVTEIAAVRIDRRGFITDEFRSLINPDRPIPRAVSRLTSITQDMVEAAPQFVDVAPRIQQVLAGAVFVAHNAPFDLRFVEWEMRRGDFGAPKGRVLCTARLARKMIPEMRHKSLDALIWFYGLVCEPRHRAYPDARVTADILVRLLDRAEEAGIGTWSALEAAIRERKKRKKRTALPTSMEFPEWA